MKTNRIKIAAMCFLMLIANTNKAQDTIHFRNGTNVVAVVKEISDESIKYKNYKNIDGPDYVSDRNEIASIHYKNGLKEVFTDVKPWFQLKKEKEKGNVTEINKQEKFSKIEIKGANRYKVNGDYLNYKQTFSLMELKDDEKINMHIRKAKINKGVKSIGFVAIPLGMMGTLMYDNSLSMYGDAASPEDRAAGIAFFVAASACLTTSIVLNVKQKEHTKEAIRLYNENY